jgi:PAS domain S-box-containing protein
MLIGVTEFFRDAEAFQVIEEQAIPAICAAKSEGELVRVWVAGCSTGEEAYSVAILLMEWFAAHGQSPCVQIFATDVDEVALGAARNGVYTQEEMSGLSQQRIERFFQPTAEGYRIRKGVREGVVFASHNLIADPPFMKLDLVVCRNVLIYLNNEIQKKLLGLFDFILNPDGYLFLGSSESIGSEAGRFLAVSKPWRIYRHSTGGHPRKAPRLPLSSGVVSRRVGAMGVYAPELTAHWGKDGHYRELLEAHGITQVLVNAANEVVFVAGNAAPYLTVPAGESSNDLFKMARPQLGATLRSAVNRAAGRRGKVALTCALPVAGSASVARIEVQPVGGEGQEPLLLIAFSREEAQPQEAPALESSGGDDWIARHMERELTAVREDLQRTIEQSRTTTEELKAANEEVTAMNEELQSANEELESSKEELQSLNEELATANATLDAKVLELEAVNVDLHNLLHCTETATLLLDRELRIRRFTPACGQLMRLIPSDVGRSIDDIVRHFSDPDLTRDCLLVMHGNPVPEREIPSDMGRCYLRKILPYRGQDGQVIGVVLTLPDITSIKQADQALRQRARELQWQADLLKRAAPILARDQEGRVIFWNPAAEALYGWPAQEALGRVSQHLLKTRFPIPLEEIVETLHGTGHWHGELVHTTCGGGEVVVDSRWTLSRDPEGNFQGIVEVINDITERKRAEEELARYHERLGELVEERTAELATANAQLRETEFAMDQSSIAMHWVDAASGRLLRVNDAACRMLGYSREELLRMRVWDIDPAVGEERFNQLAATLRPQDGTRFDSTQRTKAGAVVPVELNLYCREAPGRERYFIVFITDISHRRRAEQEILAAKEAAEAANRAKSLFLANMSHELRTPLNAVLGFSEMLAHDPVATENQLEMLKVINRSGEHLLAMINDVLDLSKIEAGAVSLECKAFDLRQTMEDIARMFELRAEEAGLRFRLEIDDGLAGFVRGDSGKLRQVLINLLGNAVKFTHSGEVALCVRTEPSAGGGLRLQLEVRDTGEGIPPDKQQEIFEPFVQLANSRSVKGTGLGLTITRSFVELMGGCIRVESEPGGGACFVVELPVAPAEADEAEAEFYRGPPVLGLLPDQPEWRVLVVEDRLESRLLLTRRLEQAGFVVRQATNGVEALTLFQQWRPQFIWMDMRMPVMDGYEATRRIRAMAGGKEVKIAALTASAFKEQHQKILEAGCDAVLHKPARSAEVFDLLARLLGVQYRYATAPVKDGERVAVPLDAAMMRRLPAELRPLLFKKSRELDYMAVMALVEQVRATDRELAQGLAGLVRGYHFDIIMELLKASEEANTHSDK